MVRPCASKENRLLCLQFAQACTKNTSNPTDLLARCGPLSPFAALSQCCPTSVRIENAGRRDGITELECNKVLQTGGFQMIRDRRATARNKNEDPCGSGLYLYTEVQWRDPDDSEDLCHLLHSWNMLRSNHPVFAKECGFDMFLEVIRNINGAWRPKNSRKDVRVRNNKRKIEDLDRQDSIGSEASFMERQDSQMSLASTIGDMEQATSPRADMSSPSTICRSRSCSWVNDEEADCQAPSKRQCAQFVYDQASVQQIAPSVEVEWWAPENLARCAAPVHSVEYWDVAAWPKLEEKEVEDEVVMSLLQQRSAPAVSV